jgi:hypothetical protein
MLDYVGQSHMTIGANAALAPDRLNNAQSALYLNSGYCTVPPGVYFTGGLFTVIAWVYRIQAVSFTGLLDFGNGPSNDNVIFALALPPNSAAYMAIYQGAAFGGKLEANIVSGQWTHLAAVYGGNNMYLFVNGQNVQSVAMWAPNNVVRQLCFIGRSNSGDPDAQAYFDDIKIYNRALSTAEIQADSIY